MRLRALAAVAAAAPMLLTVLPQGAAAAEDDRSGKPVPGEYCGPKESFYGSDGLTFTDFQVCLRPGYNNGKDNRELFTIKKDRTTYKWGGIWYNASDRWPAQWSAGGTVATDGWSSEYGMAEDQRTRYTQKSGFFGHKNGARMPCGTYNVTADLEQDGPHWGSKTGWGTEWSIKPGERTYTIEVPCQGG
ncbi:hypothetical protein QWM81_12835 [Streptomyces ficellus]|uniref:Uncharacterized protein n=1 Tax=Streptomyces ficellus TaxID=1977088 RepID=A0ABT7Z628_9ACTN|nr:hypothetical protein [Streptomyces ficellus]MDN3294921.1 hypothetical protein [Streptomyces ficellus]